MSHTVRLKEFATAGFMTRAQGESVRNRLVECRARFDDCDTFVIDLEGVDEMGPSFADECFGKLAQNLGLEGFKKSIKLIRANDTIRTLVNAVLSQRLSVPKN